MRGLIAQDIGGTVRPAEWPQISDLGFTHALIGVPWVAVEREPGQIDLSPYRDQIHAALRAGLRVIVRVTWPLPAWAPEAWYCRNQDGRTTAERALFLRLGQCPSPWARPAWEALYAVQDEIARQFPQVEFSPPGGPGGEWTFPTGHTRERLDRYVQRSLWCFDPYALEAWDRARRARLVDGAEPPREPDALLEVPGAARWYWGGLRRRLEETIRRTPGTPWIALIPKPGICPETVAAGQPFLDLVPIREKTNVLVHCLFGPGNTAESRTWVEGLFRLWPGRLGVGVETWEGLERNAQKLERTPVGYLLVDAAGLLDHPDTVRTWSRYWLRNQ